MSLQDDARGFTRGQPSEAGESALADLATKLSMHKMSRRSFINKRVMAGVGATALGPVLAACGSGSSTTSGPVTMQYAALVDNTGEQTTEISKFNQMNAGKINVQYVQLPQVATDQYSKFVTAFQSQSPTPDVVHVDVTWPAQFATPGWLAPLDQYVSNSYLGQFWPSAASLGKINGHIYGIQRYMDIGMLYYRTDLVQKYGGGTPPQTRDDIQAMATKILAGEAGNGIKYGYLLPGKKIEVIVDEWLEFIWGAGGDIGRPGNLTVNGPTQVAYAFARLRFRFKTPLLIIVLALSFFPPLAQVIPLYRILQSLHLIGTLGALILPYSVFRLPLAVLVLMAFFGEIPLDFEEAAVVDGMTRLGAFVRIILPMAAPGLFTTAIIVFVGDWNEYLFALNFTTTSTCTLPVGIVTISQTEFTTNLGILSAATILSVVPLVALTLLLERRIVSGLMADGLKG